ncbi:MAG TPA: 6-bladed beta-propeller [Acidobacteria bacterium]|nr:6-bladed beta-propeller [Acidobacteriota bacterium]
MPNGRLLSFVCVVCFATACASVPASEAPVEAADDGDVMQPAPGVDIDRATAVGQVVDTQGLEGWYPHEGSLMKYRVAIRFGQEPSTMPDGWNFGRVSSVATDSNNQVFVFHRGETADPIIVFDAEGNYLRSFGRGLFGNEHGLRIDRHDNVWVTDNGDHQVMKFSNDGELLMTLGVKGQAGTTDDTFDRPADIAFGPNDELYVADGYGNNRVVKYDADGQFVRTWGTPGTAPGEFDLVHSVAVDSTGRVYVSDRENNRIQIFDGDGEFLHMWTHLGATQNIFITPDDQVWVITHRDNIENITYDTLAGRIMRVDMETGEILGAMESPGHWIDVSDTGEIFIGSLTGNVFRWYDGPWQGM